MNLYTIIDTPEPVRERHRLKVLNTADRTLKTLRFGSPLSSHFDAIDDVIDDIEDCFKGICRRCFGPNDGPFDLCLRCDKDA